MNRLLRSCLLTALTLTIVLSSTSPAQIPAWKKVFDGQGISIGINPYNSNTIYTQGNDNRLNVSHDGGLTWSVINTILPFEIREFIIHPNDTSTIFVVNFSDGLYRSTDGGISFSLVLSNYGIDGESVVYDPVHPDTMYAGNFGDASVFRSTNRGTSWILQGHAGSTGNLCGLVVRPDSANILYAGTGAGTISKSTDEGVTWHQVKSGGSQEIPKIVIDPHHPQVAYAAAFAGNLGSTGIWKSTDGGENWALTPLQSISMWSLDIDLTHPDTLYSGTFSEAGTAVYRTTDAGATWTKMGFGFAPYNSLWNLKIDRQNGSNVYVAGTVGDFSPNGVYKLVNANAGVQGYVIDSLTSQILTSGSIQIAPSGEVYDLSQTNGFYSSVRYDTDTTSIRSFSVYINSVLFHQESVGLLLDSMITRNLAVAPGTISGTIYNDANNNGIRDGGDSGLVGWVVHAAGSGNFTAASDLNGHYSFNDLFPGTYVVSEQGNFGWKLTAPVESTYTLTINNSTRNFSSTDFGNHVVHRVTSVLPIPYSMAAMNTSLQVTFDSVMDPTSIHDTSTVLVRGSVSGLHRCSISFNGSNTILTLTPTKSFFPGEVVSANISGKVKVANGISVTPHSWQFSIMTVSSDGIFGPKTDLIVGSQPWGVAVGDIDHDGDVDIVTANMNSNSVSVLKNNGNGTFAAKVDYPVGIAPLAVCLADVDNDGNLDIVVANSGSSSITVLKNDGTGNFPNRFDYPAGGSPSSISIGDIRGNGATDVVVPISTNNIVAVLPDTGSGFGSALTYSAGVFPWSATIADMNNDGGNDIATVNSLSSSLFGILSNTGFGKISQPVTYSLGGYARGIAIADFNNDGRPDVVATNSQDNNFTFSPQNGIGTFSSSTTFNTGAQPWAIATADLNGDGYMDVCVTNASSSSFSVFLNNGGTSFTRKDYTTNSLPRAIAIADFDGDGDLDVVVANSGGNTVSVFFNVLSEPVISGWNMICLPTNLTNTSKSSVYPTAISPAFIYQNGYVSVDTLSIGNGYWVNFDSATVIIYAGSSVLADSVPLRQGWNLIGGVSLPVSTGSLTTQPPGLLESGFFSYNGSYQIASSLDPGFAYWVRSAGSGELYISAAQSNRNPVASNQSQTFENMNSLEISDAKNHRQILYFAFPNQNPGNSKSTILPPVPPTGGFDARFGNNSYLKIAENGMTTPERVMVQASSFPVKLAWHLQQNNAYRWNLHLKGSVIHLTNDGAVELTSNNQLGNISLEPGAPVSAEIPKEYFLGQNFPNPFNPSTVIQFGLPVRSQVRLSVMNILGETVAELLNQEIDEGVHSYSWTPALPSGIYFYQLRALRLDGSGDVFSETKKTLLLK